MTDTPTTPGAPDRLIRETEFRARLGSPARSTIWRWRRANPDFPRPRKVGPNRIGYVEAEVVAWLRARELA